MNVNEAIELLKPFKAMPLEAVACLRKNWVEAEPLLLAELDRHIEDPYTEDTAFFFYAMFLCAEQRCEAAFERYVTLCRMPKLFQNILLGDVLCESMNSLLYNTCSNRFDKLKELVEDPTVNEYARSAALEALQAFALEGTLSREEIESYCLDLLGHKLEQEQSYVWVQTATLAEQFQLKKALPLIKMACDSYWIDSFFDSYEDMEKRFKSGTARKPPCLKLIATEDELHGFAENWAIENPILSEAALLSEAQRETRKQRMKNGKEPRRNDKCPCGSGKKYKKCCIVKGLTLGDENPAPKNTADEWIEAGYYFIRQYDMPETYICWNKSWKEALKLIPPTVQNPADTVCDTFFNAPESFADWMEDFLIFFQDNLNNYLSYSKDALTFIDEAQSRFPKMNSRFNNAFIRARIDILLLTGKTEQAFECLKAEQKNSSDPAYWFQYEVEIITDEPQQYGLATDWTGALERITTAKGMATDDDQKELLTEEETRLKRVLQCEAIERKQRAAMLRQLNAEQLELF